MSSFSEEPVQRSAENAVKITEGPRAGEGAGAGPGAGAGAGAGQELIVQMPPDVVKVPY